MFDYSEDIWGKAVTKDKEYTGNEGVRETRTYQKTFLVFWPLEGNLDRFLKQDVQMAMDVFIKKCERLGRIDEQDCLKILSHDFSNSYNAFLTLLCKYRHTHILKMIEKSQLQIQRKDVLSLLLRSFGWDYLSQGILSVMENIPLQQKSNMINLLLKYIDSEKIRGTIDSIIYECKGTKDGSFHPALSIVLRFATEKDKQDILSKFASLATQNELNEFIQQIQTVPHEFAKNESVKLLFELRKQYLVQQINKPSPEFSWRMPYVKTTRPAYDNFFAKQSCHQKIRRIH